MNRVSDERLAELIKTHANPNGVPIGGWQQSKFDAFTELQSLRTASVAGVEDATKSITNKLKSQFGGNIAETDDDDVIAERIIAAELTTLLAERDASRGESEAFLAEQRALGRRVVVSVEVYDTPRTSKRGHAGTLEEAVAQVRAALKKQETISGTETEGSKDVGAEPKAQ